MMIIPETCHTPVIWNLLFINNVYTYSIILPCHHFVCLSQAWSWISNVICSKI